MACSIVKASAGDTVMAGEVFSIRSVTRHV